MNTNGLDGILVETHDWDASVSFWQALGYTLELETDHRSGRLRHPLGGPYIFVAERPPEQPLRTVLGFAVSDSDKFTPPTSGSVIHGFEKQHWPALQMLLNDPDGREIVVDAPLNDA